MCMSSPKIPPPPPPPPPPQDVKAPDTMAATRKGKQVGMGAGTLLTGPSGVANNALTTGGSTLLGG